MFGQAGSSRGGKEDFTMIRAVARQMAGLLAPTWLQSYQAKVTLMRKARQWRQQSDTLGSIEELAREITPPIEELAKGIFGPDKIYAHQRWSEISRLLELLSAHPPTTICEIGASAGGNLLLFSQVAAPNATIISIDIDYTSPRQYAFPHLARRGQRMWCLRMDSHAPKTLAKVRKILGGRPIDFLFIDGDHTLQGVKMDYDMYSSLVRPGGVIAFHDIVPDNRMRFGVDLGSYVGEVPLFWKEAKQRHIRHLELIENPEQDGYGIGVLWLDSAKSSVGEALIT